jgi:hypothetical protein
MKIRKIYLKILFLLFSKRIKSFYGKKLLLIDIDFTLVKHDLNDVIISKKLLLKKSHVCPKVINLILQKKMDGYCVSIFTARGLGSYYDVKKLVKSLDLDFDLFIFLGSTTSKIDFLGNLYNKFQDLILCDDLRDWDFKNNDFKKLNYIIPKTINHIHPNNL